VVQELCGLCVRAALGGGRCGVHCGCAARRRDCADAVVSAAYWIAFGAHGPRALPPPGEGWKVFGYTALGVTVAFAIFAAIRAFGKGSPRTMTQEYQEATNEYLKVRPLPFPGPSCHSSQPGACMHQDTG